MNQASNSTAGPPLLQPLDWLIQPRRDPVPAKVSVEASENQPPFNPKWIMPPLPVAAKATSDPKTDPPPLLQPLDWLTQPRLDPVPVKLSVEASHLPGFPLPVNSLCFKRNTVKMRLVSHFENFLVVA